MLVISGNLILTGAWTTMFCRIKIYKRWLCAIVHTFCSIDCSHLKLKKLHPTTFCFCVPPQPHRHRDISVFV